MLLATGQSLSQVANELGITLYTARTHKRIFEKLNVRTQHELVSLLLRAP